MPIPYLFESLVPLKGIGWLVEITIVFLFLFPSIPPFLFTRIDLCSMHVFKLERFGAQIEMEKEI